MLIRKIKNSLPSIFEKRNLPSCVFSYADFKNIRFFGRITPFWKLQLIEVHGGKGEKRKELEEESGKGRKLGEMMKRWKEEKIKEQERGRGNGIQDEEGNRKAGNLLFLRLTKEIIHP